MATWCAVGLKSRLNGLRPRSLPSETGQRHNTLCGSHRRFGLGSGRETWGSGCGGNSAGSRTSRETLPTWQLLPASLYGGS